LKSELRDLTAVDIFQGDLVGVVNGSGLGGAAVHTASAKHTAHTTETTTSEELSKQVLGGHATTSGTALETGLTILIVNLSLLGIGEDLVGMRDLLELFLGIGVVCVLVCVVLDACSQRREMTAEKHTRVVLEGSDLVSLLQLLLSGSRSDLNVSFSKNSYFAKVGRTYTQCVIVLGFLNHFCGFWSCCLLTCRRR
jgi:hypothetical protein